METIIDLAVASFLLLFLEMALIRWVTACAFILAYFTNIILIGCFLGFGIGCALKTRVELFKWTAFLLGIILCVCRLIDGRSIGNPFANAEFIFSANGPLSWLFVLLILYSLIVALFICLGNFIGRRLDQLVPRQGYAINVAGSLVGTILFAVICYFNAVPTVWFALIIGLLLFLQRNQPRPQAILSAVLLGSALLLVHEQQKHALWSPYYKIQLRRLPPAASGSFELLVNNDQHQLALNLSDRWTRSIAFYRDWKSIYQFPYRALGRPARQVLVLGAGTGNDVEAALRANASKIDAIELDPVIYSVGRRFHPEQPYHDPRVEVFINDARNFLRRTTRHYDVVILGWLDSHRLFSVLSNVRQDNFMYTVDAFRQIREHLTDDGVVCLSFYVARPWVARKLYDMLRISFGHDPYVFDYPAGGYKDSGHLFIIGKNPEFKPMTVPGFQDLRPAYAPLRPTAVPTDDWPYLYVRGKSLSSEYLIVLGVLLSFSVLAVMVVLRGTRKVQLKDFSFFLLGAAFMLLETKNITVLALAFGSTWITTSLSVTGVLVMILVSLWLVERRWIPSRGWTWALLFGSLLISAVWSDQWISAGPWVRALATVGVISMTFALANIVFIDLYSSVNEPSLSLGLNLIGAVVGGLTEYGTLMVGIKAMYGVVILFYAAAYFLIFKKEDPPLF